MSVTFGTMQDYARRQMLDSVGSRANAVIVEAINDGLLYLAKDTQNVYWTTIGELAINASYSTGTVALTNGSATCTLSNGTFPSWAASGKIEIGNQWYKISSRDSNTQLTLETSWNQDTDGSSTYILYQDEYSLATDVLSIGERVFYGEDWLWGAVPIGYEELLKYQEAYSSGQKYGHFWARRGSDIVLTPYPTTARTVHYVYTKRPTQVTTGTSSATNLDMPDDFQDLLECAVDVQLAKRGVCVISMQEALQMYQICWKGSKDMDEAQRRPAIKWLKNSGYGRRREPQYGDNP